MREEPVNHVLLLMLRKSRIAYLLLQLLFSRKMEIGIVCQIVKHLDCFNFATAVLAAVYELLNAGNQLLMLGINKFITCDQSVVKFDCHLCIPPVFLKIVLL